MEYRIEVQAKAMADGERIGVRVHIERSPDGEDYQEIAVFQQAFSVAMTNQAIGREIQGRVAEYVKMDANNLSQATLQERADNLAEALTGRSITI